MTSSVKFFGIKAITVGAALSMTAGLAFAADDRVHQHDHQFAEAGSAGDPRPLDGSAEAREEDPRDHLHQQHAQPFDPLAVDRTSATQLQTMTSDKPKIDLEINFDYNSA